jgi:hypothetical protein
MTAGRCVPVPGRHGKDVCRKDNQILCQFGVPGQCGRARCLHGKSAAAAQNSCFHGIVCVHTILVWRSEVRIILAASPKCGLLNQSHTRFNKLLVSFDSEVRKTSVPQKEANFGIGTLAPDRILPQQAPRSSSWGGGHSQSGGFISFGKDSCRPLLISRSRKTFEESATNFIPSCNFFGKKAVLCDSLNHRGAGDDLMTLMAQLRHDSQARQCPVLRQERTQFGQTAMSHFDPKRALDGSRYCAAAICCRVEK